MPSSFFVLQKTQLSFYFQYACHLSSLELPLQSPEKKKTSMVSSSPMSFCFVELFLTNKINAISVLSSFSFFDNGLPFKQIASVAAKYRGGWERVPVKLANEPKNVVWCANYTSKSNLMDNALINNKLFRLVTKVCSQKFPSHEERCRSQMKKAR